MEPRLKWGQLYDSKSGATKTNTGVKAGISPLPGGS